MNALYKQVTIKFSEGDDTTILSTIPTSCAILPTMFCVSGVHRRVVEGRGVGSPGCVVHVHVYGD